MPVVGNKMNSTNVPHAHRTEVLARSCCRYLVQKLVQSAQKKMVIHVLLSAAHRGVSKVWSTVGNQAETEEKMGAALPIRSTPDQPIWIPPPVPSSLLPAPFGFHCYSWPPHYAHLLSVRYVLSVGT